MICESAGQFRLCRPCCPRFAPRSRFFHCKPVARMTSCRLIFPSLPIFLKTLILRGEQTMKRLAAIALVGAVLALATPSARACYPVCCAPCVTPCCVQYVEKTVTCYRPEWKTRDVVCTVMRPVPREVTEKYTCTVLVPEWKDEKRTICICKYIPKEVEREVA